MRGSEYEKYDRPPDLERKMLIDPWWWIRVGFVSLLSFLLTHALMGRCWEASLAILDHIDRGHVKNMLGQTPMVRQYLRCWKLSVNLVRARRLHSRLLGRVVSVSGSTSAWEQNFFLMCVCARFGRR